MCPNCSTFFYTGMGLAVAYGIIASHSGTITVSSVSGQGATFEVYLPQIQVATTDGTHAAEPIPTGKERLLLVDDEAAVARLGQTLFERLGYEVVVCLSSGEALEAFRAAPQRFDLVITDQTMPCMTGDALASALRRSSPANPVPLIAGMAWSVMTRSKSCGAARKACRASVLLV
jgi:CheY-like chemotaxis protein